MSQTCDLPPFSSQVVPQDPVTSNSVRLMQDEIQRYLNLLRSAMCADLQVLEDRITTLERRVDACCGST